jgi:hypothetical protein
MASSGHWNRRPMAPSRGDRIAGAFGALLWFGAAVWIAFLDFAIGWKVLFVAFALTGCLNYLLVFTRSETLFDVLGHAFRRHIWRR